MIKKKRWGKKYKDNRDWKSYNEQLVKRGEFYINPRFLSTWNKEIEEMNIRKEGKPYLYPESMIGFLGILHVKSFHYRDLEGIMRALSRKFNNFPIIYYSQICRRVNKLGINFNANENDIVAGADGSGIKVSNRGEWMREKWHMKRGWIKVVVLGDKKGNIVDVKVGNETLDEGESSRNLVKKHHKKIKKFLGDGLYDCNEMFDLCDQFGINPVIKIRKNAASDGFTARANKARAYKGLGYERWAEENEYGARWPCTEGIFSAVKRIFGEYVSSSREENMYHEAEMKFWAYSQIKNIT